MVIVAPQEVVWQDTFSVGFTTAVRVTDMPTAYGFLRLDEGRWNFLVAMDNQPYGDSDLRRADLAQMLELLPCDIIVLMEPDDCSVFRSEVAPTVHGLRLEVPECLYSSVQS